MPKRKAIEDISVMTIMQADGDIYTRKAVKEFGRISVSNPPQNYLGTNPIAWVMWATQNSLPVKDRSNHLQTTDDPPIGEQSKLIHRDLWAIFTANRAGNSSTQAREKSRTNLLIAGCMAICLLAVVFTFGLMPTIISQQDGWQDAPTIQPVQPVQTGPLPRESNAPNPDVNTDPTGVPGAGSPAAP